MAIRFLQLNCRSLAAAEAGVVGDTWENKAVLHCGSWEGNESACWEMELVE